MDERYNQEKAQKEAEILRKKVESGEVSSYPEAQERLQDRDEIIKREATRVAERFAALESLARKICEGPVTLENLMPLIDAVANERKRAISEYLWSQIDPGIGLQDIRHIRVIEKKWEEITYARRRAAFLIIREGKIWKDIIRPVLEKRFPDVNDYNAQIEAITMGLKKAAEEEGKDKKIKK